VELRAKEGRIQGKREKKREGEGADRKGTAISMVTLYKRHATTESPLTGVLVRASVIQWTVSALVSVVEVRAGRDEQLQAL
jgi:hypothetical protein